MNSQSDLCQTHHNIINSYCLEDKMSLCSDCIKDHASHAQSIFSFPDFFIKMYKSFQFLGKGTYGTVFRVENSFTGSPKAVKFLLIPKDGNLGSLDEVKIETHLLESLKHKNIMNCNEVFYEERKKDFLVIIIMDFC